METEYKALPRGYVQTESSTNKTLQMFLHYNFYLSLIFVVLEIVVLVDKLSKYELDVFGQVLTPLTFGVWGASEAFRLWFGYTGNLREKLPQISVFFLLSLFPQLPCLLYLMHLQGLQYPFERVAGISLFVMTTLELFLSYFTIQSLIKKQTQSYFRLVDDQTNDEYTPPVPVKF